MDQDWYHFFSHFWWLVFPLFWMIAALGRAWSHHARANRVLDLVKTYVDQGKEPPPELLRTLQGPFGHGLDGDREVRRYYRRHRHGWVGVFLFMALAAGFAMMAWSADPGMDLTHHKMGLIFVALIMAGLAVGNLVSALVHMGHHDIDRMPPK